MKTKNGDCSHVIYDLQEGLQLYILLQYHANLTQPITYKESHLFLPGSMILKLFCTCQGFNALQSMYQSW